MTEKQRVLLHKNAWYPQVSLHLHIFPNGLNEGLRPVCEWGSQYIWTAHFLYHTQEKAGKELDKKLESSLQSLETAGNSGTANYK